MNDLSRPAAATARLALYDYAPVQESFADALRAGLAKPQKAIPSRFLYDETGSQLFDRICELSEYYPTRTELSILADRAGEIAEVIGPHAALIEFGAGSSAKARLVLDALQDPVAYVPIDVSRDHLVHLAEEIVQAYPTLEVAAVCADYTQALSLPEFPRRARRVGFFPGSTIGNLTPEDAQVFLAGWSGRLAADGVMIVGVDLRKAAEVIRPAYDDAEGVTAAFSLNVLVRANRECGADFDPAAFRHEVDYDPATGRVSIWLRSSGRQSVHVAGRVFDFVDGERIHVEDSNKYAVADFQTLAAQAGYRPLAVWTDPAQLFSVHALGVG